MRQINFKEVGMKNYGPYIDPMILPIENNKLTLITGPNGVGKSMILDALPFTFFGTTSKNARGDDVVNNKVGKGCHTWVEFTINGIPYRTDRYHKYPKLGNTVHLFRNNEDKPYKKGHNEVLPEIERLICPYKLFMNTLLFAQKVKNFFTDLTDGEKKEIFRKILNLDNYVTYYNETTDRFKQKTEERVTLMNDLSSKNELLSYVSEQIASLNEEKKQFNLKKNEIITSYEMKLQQITNDKRDVSLNMPKIDPEKINHIKEEVNKSQRILGEFDNKLTSIEKEVEEKRKSKEVELKNSSLERKQKLSNDYPIESENICNPFDEKRLELDQKISQKTTERQKLQNKIQELDLLKSGLEKQKSELDVDALDGVVTCPTCLQPVTEDSKHTITEKIDEYSKDIEDNLDQRRIVLIEQEKIDEELNELKINLQDVIKERDTKVNELNTKHNQDLYNVDVKLASLIQTLNDLAKETIAKKIADLKKEKMLEEENLSLKTFDLEEEKKLIEYANKFEIQLDEFEKEMQVTQKLLEEKQQELYDESRLADAIKKSKGIKDNIEELKIQIITVNKEIEILEFWKVAFSSSGIPSLLIDDSVPFMNSKISDYLDQISNGRYTVSFDTLKATKAGEFRDKISVNVLDNLTKADKRVQFSGGQTRVVDIATILTLCDLQSNVQDVWFNLLLFDEIFDSLDDDNTGFVSKVLRSLVKNKAIFIISHTHIDQIEADETLQLK